MCTSMLTLIGTVGVAAANADIWRWLGGADSATATVVALVAILGLARSLWRRTVGRRRRMRASLYRIGIGANEGYIRAYLGPPIYGQLNSGHGELAWVTPYAHVSVTFHGGGAIGYVVTVMDRTFGLDLGKFSFGQLNGRLGRTRFEGSSDRTVLPDQFLSVGARRSSYQETYYFGNPGGYLHFMLAWSDSSNVGKFDLPSGLEPGSIGDGNHGQNEVANAHMHKYGRPNTVGVFREKEGGRPGALDLDTFRLLPVPRSAWVQLEGLIARFWRPFD